jgi:hypothetical protein
MSVMQYEDNIYIDQKYLTFFFVVYILKLLAVKRKNDTEHLQGALCLAITDYCSLYSIFFVFMQTNNEAC